MVTAAGVTADADWLEPSSGAGVFIEVMRENAIPRSSCCHDLCAEDPRGADYPRDDVSRNRLSCLDDSQARQFDRIVGNPPYVPFDELPSKPAQLLGQSESGRKIACFRERRTFGQPLSQPLSADFASVDHSRSCCPPRGITRITQGGCAPGCRRYFVNFTYSDALAQFSVK